MSRKLTSLTIDDLDELLDRKFDEKLKSIHDEIANIKYVVEHKVYKVLSKEMRKGFERIEKRFDHHDEINAAVAGDLDSHDVRITRLEKNAGLFDKN